MNGAHVPAGMSSGICTMLAARDALAVATKVVGVVSTGAPAYRLSFAAGRVVEHPATTVLADGLACRCRDGEALEAIMAGADRIVAVSADEVAHAMPHAVQRHA